MRYLMLLVLLVLGSAHAQTFEQLHYRITDTSDVIESGCEAFDSLEPNTRCYLVEGTTFDVFQIVWGAYTSYDEGAFDASNWIETDINGEYKMHEINYTSPREDGALTVAFVQITPVIAMLFTTLE